MKFVIITGMSGSGKTNALKYMEDMGYFCVDNLPPTLLGKFAELCNQGASALEQVAVVMDIRGRQFFSGLVESLDYMEEQGFPYEVLFLTASEEELVNRYNFTRRAHPLAVGGRLIEGIRKEAGLLKPLMDRASFVVDTTDIPPKKLGAVLRRYFYQGDTETSQTRLTILSFGFKRGIPTDADMVFDVRFLDNPYNEKRLRKHSGKEQAVKDYVFADSAALPFAEKMFEIIDMALPNYHKSSKRELVVAVGCTGGMHRSVAIAEYIADKFVKKGITPMIEHRDMEREKMATKYTPVE